MPKAETKATKNARQWNFSTFLRQNILCFNFGWNLLQTYIKVSVASLHNTQSHRLVVLHTSYITTDNREQVIHNYSCCMFYYRRRIPHSVMRHAGVYIFKTWFKRSNDRHSSKTGLLLTVHTKKIAQDFVLSILSFLFKKCFFVYWTLLCALLSGGLLWFLSLL